MLTPHAVPSCSSVEACASHTPHANSSCSSVESLRASRTPHANSSCSSVEACASRTPQDYLAIICDAHPCPATSGYRRAHWLYECRTAARWIAGYADAELRRQLYAIEELGLTSKNYEIIEIERKDSRVNVDRLREKEPDIFAELVHLKASDAQKIIGRRTLYELARDKIGETAISEYETVNVGDLEKVMAPAKSCGFIETDIKVIDWAVLEIEEPEAGA